MISIPLQKAEKGGTRRGGREGHSMFGKGKDGVKRESVSAIRPSRSINGT